MGITDIGQWMGIDLGLCLFIILRLFFGQIFRIGTVRYAKGL